MEPNGQVALWSGIVGFLLPAAIATINRHQWASEVKAVVAFVVCLIAAAGTAYLAGDIDEGGDLATAALVVFGSAITTYNLWFKPSGIAERVETATG